MIILGIGSNLSSKFGDRFKNIELAVSFIESHNIQILKKSSFYETPSYPNPKKPKFLNIGLNVECNFSPERLIKKFNKIEKTMQRIRGVKNKPRTCDIDIIDYDGKVLNSKIIKIPHPKAHLRNFVLFPIREIFPNWIHPILNKEIDFLIKKLGFISRNEITKIKEHVTVRQ